MQQIERYGVIALVFLLVTIVAVSFWGDSKSPGFWSRLTGRGAKKDVAAQVQANPEVAVQPAGPTLAPEATGERALQTELPLSAPAPTEPAFASNAQPTTAPYAAPMYGPAAAPQAAPLVAAPVSTPTAAPVSTPVPTRAAPPAGSTVYTVQKGDSLMRIAARTLGAKSRWTEIRDMNAGVDPRSLKVGMKLALPVSATPARAAPARATTGEKRVVPVNKPAVGPAPQKKAATGATDTYVVRKGDTLKEIAEKRLGSSSRWREIASANPRLDPNRLLVGTSIRIPAGTSGSRGEPRSAPALASAMPRETNRSLASSRPTGPHVR
jgi:nucleoid-associated protein YgaU